MYQSTTLEERLAALVRSSAELMAALSAARSLGLGSWCIGAGAPSLAWEVTNQAHVHTWFMREFGREVAPLLSLEDGVATWPEYATCVGVSLEDGDAIRVIAPHGLEDLFALRVRHNPARADIDTYRQRLTSKRFAQRWPQLVIASLK